MNEVWRSVRAALALQLERKTSHKHSCYYVLLYSTVFDAGMF